MGMTIEFISADPAELAALYAAGREERFDTARYPRADFSLHLLIPDDTDSLSRALNKQNRAIPPTFRQSLIEQIWYDGKIESLTVIAEGFVTAVAAMTDLKSSRRRVTGLSLFPTASLWTRRTRIGQSWRCARWRRMLALTIDP